MVTATKNENPGYTLNTNRIAAGACRPERTVPMLSDYPAHIPSNARSIQISPGIADLLLRACAAAGAQASRDADRLQQAGRSIEAAQAASTALEYLIAHDRLLAACGIAEEATA